jgi:hypothetical protein
MTILQKPIMGLNHLKCYYYDHTMHNTAIIGHVLDLPHVEGITATADQVATYLDSHGAVIIDRFIEPERMDQLSQDLQTVSGCFYGTDGSFVGAHTVRNAGKPLGESKIAQEFVVDSSSNSTSVRTMV